MSDRKHLDTEKKCLYKCVCERVSETCIKRFECSGRVDKRHIRICLFTFS